MPKETMRVTLATKVRSYMYDRVQYLRGQVYVLDADVAKRLLATGQFKIATLPPPDPKAVGRKKAAQLLDTLAALPDSALDRLINLAGLAATEAGVEDAAPAPEPEPEPTPEPEPDPPNPKGKARKTATKAKAEGATTKAKPKRRRSTKKPTKATPATGTLADLQE